MLPCTCPQTRQSPIDPFDVDYDKYPELLKATPHAFVLEPGEIVLVPKNWWHYAVALDHSITAMRNFYHYESNMTSMVEIILKSVKRIPR